MSNALRDAIAYYSSQGAPGDQTMLIALLREAQELSGGALPAETLEEIARAYQIRETGLRALIRRIPSLRVQDAPHSLELCGRCAAHLALFAHRELEGRAAVVLRVTGCMKNCKCGPSIRWDGALHSRADEALLRRLAEK